MSALLHTHGALTGAGFGFWAVAAMGFSLYYVQNFLIIAL
jgi:hypothetical protein